MDILGTIAISICLENPIFSSLAGNSNVITIIENNG